MQSYSGAPSDFAKLIATGLETVTSGATGEDLVTFVDVTGFDYVLVIATVVLLTGATPTQLDVKFRSDDNSGGTSPTNAKDAAGVDLIATIVGTEFAVGTSIMLQVRTRGLEKFGSPLFIATGGTSVDVAFSVLGIGPRQNAEIAAHWPSAGAASVEVVETPIS